MRKLVVISGGTRGIGKAIAFRFAQSGTFDIVTCSRNKSNIEAFETDFKAAFPDVNCFVWEADLEKKEAVAGFAEKIKNVGRKIDVLINNAGAFIPGALMEEEEGTFEKLISLNVAAAYHLSRALCENIKASATHIFNICSTASITAYTNGGSYCISKYALLGFSKVLREEMKPYYVKVSSVLPGATYTDSWSGASLPESRFIKAEDIAEIIFSAYNLSPAACVEEILVRPVQGDI